MDYNLYNSEDFAADESFIAYCNQTDVDAVLFWSDYVALHPEKLDEIYNAESLIAKLSLNLNDQELQQEFTKFDDFLNADLQLNVTSAKNLPKATNYKKWVLICAVFMLFSFGGFQFYQNQFTKLTYLTYHIGNGKIGNLMLSDGTKIVINANSTIKYPKEFKGNYREVELSGEAYFEVAKDKSKPFSVLANGIKTTVLGTKFNVLAYKNLPEVNVALLEGKVEVATASGNDKIILNPSEQATYTIKNSSLTRTSFNAELISSWKQGVIVFENANFKAIAQKLQNIYGIKIIDQTRGLKWSYSGQFNQTDYLTIIQSICFTKKINYKQTNQTNQTFILTN